MIELACAFTRAMSSIMLPVVSITKAMSWPSTATTSMIEPPSSTLSFDRRRPAPLGITAFIETSVLKMPKRPLLVLNVIVVSPPFSSLSVSSSTVAPDTPMRSPNSRSTIVSPSKSSGDPRNMSLPSPPAIVSLPPADGPPLTSPSRISSPRNHSSQSSPSPPISQSSMDSVPPLLMFVSVSVEGSAPRPRMSWLSPGATKLSTSFRMSSGWSE